MKLQLITTTYEKNQTKTIETKKEFTHDPGVEFNVVNIYPQVEYQTFDGFGGSITDSAGYIYSLMSDQSKKELIQAYFGPNGNCYQTIRSHIDSCDFSVNQYEALSDPTDMEFESFNLDRNNRYILPLLLDAEAANGKPIEMMLSPWSPPSFMKTNGIRIQGGKLKEEYREFWAEYICHYIKSYRAKGFLIKKLSIQNEPNAKQTWDSCLYTGEEEKIFLRDYLYPALRKNGLEDIEIFIWDHNKERMFERACEIIDETTEHMISGIAFHWYTGDHFDAISLVREKFKDKKIILSEGCVEFSRFDENAQLLFAQMYAHDIIGNINSGMNSFIDWNIVLDTVGGPNHVGNFCHSPIVYDAQNDKVIKNLSYTYIGHFSRYIVPGAKRIASTKYTDKLELTALKNPDGTVVFILLNRLDEMQQVNLRINGQVTEVTVPGNSISTGLLSQ
ncbi:glycoside hydrolase family 30 protein [Bacillus kwashiorkori]|uniref:glycoside hydrolase family 30 protein n=1 Tax=Bacillus kwashiorkori TaxID=1522318 RepID=UPI000781BBC1|nr:glycoside hydrolase family 30 beta sandwich domain-containing protein [Bacillus kwashiorkori]